MVSVIAASLSGGGLHCFSWLPDRLPDEDSDLTARHSAPPGERRNSLPPSQRGDPMTAQRLPFFSVAVFILIGIALTGFAK
ncbi:MAG TPA: hypothetical protein VGB12_13250 [bacterium]